MVRAFVCRAASRRAEKVSGGDLDSLRDPGRHDPEQEKEFPEVVAQLSQTGFQVRDQSNTCLQACIAAEARKCIFGSGPAGSCSLPHIAMFERKFLGEWAASLSSLCPQAVPGYGAANSHRTHAALSCTASV